MIDQVRVVHSFEVEGNQPSTLIPISSRIRGGVHPVSPSLGSIETLISEN